MCQPERNRDSFCRVAFFFSSRRRHTRFDCDWSSDVCSSDLGQARRGHVYHVNFYQVRPGEEKAYDSALVSVVAPVFDELVKRKAVGSYLLLTKTAGSGEYTNVVIVEVAKPSAAEGTFQL